MSTKHLISPGIGFSPGSVKYIVTRGLTAAAAPAQEPIRSTRRNPSQVTRTRSELTVSRDQPTRHEHAEV